MSPCQLRRVPVGNTISARWRVSVNNSLSLSELDLFLEIVDPKGFSFPLDFSVVADDIISFVYEGQLQELPGVYLVNLFERRGLTSQARLDRAAFELVKHTHQATPLDADNLEITPTIDLEDSELAILAGSPYIQDGYWYIDGRNLGVQAEGQTPHVQDGYWYIGDQSTGQPAFPLPRGPYDPDADYGNLNFVEADGSGYICIKPCKGIPVTNTAYWFKCVSKGDSFSYADLTPEQKAELAHDATIAAQAAQAAAEAANSAVAGLANRTTALEGRATSLEGQIAVKSVEDNSDASSQTKYYERLNDGGLTLTLDSSGRLGLSLVRGVVQSSLAGSGTRCLVDGQTVHTAITSAVEGKEDRTAVVAAVNDEDATLAVTELAAKAGRYYRLDVAVGTLAVTLPAMTDTSVVRTVVLFLTAGTAPAVTFAAADGRAVYYADGFEIEAGGTYEVNALFNGAAWVIASVTIITE